MEGNLPPRALVHHGGGGAFDLEASMQHPPPPFPFAQDPHLHHGMVPVRPNPMMQEFGNVVKTSPSDEEDVDDGHHHGGGGKIQWHRVKWSSNMVKLLVSSVAYIDEDVDADYGGGASARQKHAMLKRKGKWKLVSAVMTDRGFPVSPQQCEDKFNDLNKRYKRLTEILGRGTACQIVEQPELLEAMQISGKLKEEARKQLISKHLHYEEMCSYHNRNRMCLLEDPTLQKSLRLALRSGEEHTKKNQFGYDDEDFSDDDEFDDLEVSAEDHHHRIHGGAKRLKQHDQEETHFGSNLSEVAVIDMNKMLSEGSGGPTAEKSHPTRAVHGIRVEKRRLKIKAAMLKVEHKHLKWQMYCKEKDRELEKMRLENEKMKLENERMELELKLKEIEMGIKPKKIFGD
uniref:Myb/SANT-like DNA-binding domain-containing protein n=1 Tax=Leersia perrieri TaxID=77586 RepID=A0A0D9VGU0_9ORYZ